MVALVGAPQISSVRCGWLEGNFLSMGHGDLLHPALHMEVVTPKSSCLPMALLKHLFPPLKKRHIGVGFDSWKSEAFLKSFLLHSHNLMLLQSETFTVLNNTRCVVFLNICVGDKQAVNASVLVQCAELHSWSLTGFILLDWRVFVRFFYGVAMYFALQITWEFFPKQRLALCMLFILVCIIF